MSLRILVVDDEESIRESIAIHLREKGYEVQVFENPLYCPGTEANPCRSPHDCGDVLIIDQWMPRMSGLDYLLGRRKWGCAKTRQHVALMSANLPPDLRRQAVELGCEVFEKPVRLIDIEEWLKSLPE